MNYENKIKIIDEICKYHPSEGVERGWSKYTGGMKDSGSWYFRKMLDATETELENFLNGLIERENDRKNAPQNTKSFEEATIEMWKEHERKMFFGK